MADAAYYREYRKRKKAEAANPSTRPKAPRRVGRQSKSAAISENFNPTKIIKPTKADLKKAGAIPRKKSEKEAFDMLADMRHVYSEVGGREKLEQMVMGDDKMFVGLAKDLMKVETALLTASIRKNDTGGGAGGQTVFVVLKGLEDEKRLSVQSGVVDLEQVQQALNPDTQRRTRNIIGASEARKAPTQLTGRGEQEDGDPFAD